MPKEKKYRAICERKIIAVGTAHIPEIRKHCMKLANDHKLPVTLLVYSEIKKDFDYWGEFAPNRVFVNMFGEAHTVSEDGQRMYHRRKRH